MDKVAGAGRGRGPHEMRKIVIPQRGAGMGNRPSRKNKGMPRKETDREHRARKVASSGVPGWLGKGAGRGIGVDCGDPS